MSGATKLVSGDTNGVADVFVRDLQAGTTTRVSTAADGSQGNGLFQFPSISADGRVVAFQSESSNLVPDDTNGLADVFVHTQPAVALTSYGYDRLSRLLGASGPDGAPTYTYDPVGNRTSKTLGSSTSYTYDRADRITSAGATSITVDAVGNLTAKGPDSFAYDGANRLISATVAGITETYTYDGDGVRFSRQVGGGPVIRYVSDPSGSLPVTIADGARRYIWGIGLAYAVSGSTVEVYHTDRLGSIRAISDASGAVTATYRTDEWGVPTATSGSSSQPYGFTGEPADATGLVYLRARYYDPSLGRFMTRDPWGGGLALPSSQHRYAYALNRPVSFVDPTGFGPEEQRRDLSDLTVVRTQGVCVDGQLGVGVFVTGNICIAADIRGDWRILIAGAVGGMAGGSATVLVGPFWSDGYVDELAGPFGQFGGAVAVFGAAGGEVWLTRGLDGRPVQVTFPATGVGLAGLLPAEIHAGGGATVAIDPTVIVRSLLDVVTLPNLLAP